MAATRARAALKLVAAPSPASPAASPPAMDDSELLAALRRGDTGAATAFHDRMRPQVERTIRRLFGGRDVDRDDVTQQALIEILTTIGRYRGDCSLDSWASAITAHVVFKHSRRRKTEHRIFSALDAGALSEVRSPSRTGRDTLLRNGVGRVRALLTGIDESKVWAFLLHDVCGYDLREVAQITGVSPAAAQTRLVRGRREVHELIAGDPELASLLDSLGGDS